MVLHYPNGDYAKIYNHKGKTRTKLYNKYNQELEAITNAEGKTINFKIKSITRRLS